MTRKKGKSSGKPKAKDIHLLADRLCYLEEGMDGLRRRNGMLKEPGYWEQYDTIARKMLIVKGI